MVEHDDSTRSNCGDDTQLNAPSVRQLILLLTFRVPNRFGVSDGCDEVGDHHGHVWALWGRERVTARRRGMDSEMNLKGQQQSLGARCIDDEGSGDGKRCSAPSSDGRRMHN